MFKKIIGSLLAMVLAIALISAGIINLNSLFNYENQPVPVYIAKDNTPANNDITNEIATLGRVLFYDKNLSLNNTIACASCHHQALAFGDTAALSVGFEGGLTGRHSMRLVNARFGTEAKFFWDERANSLETQTTMPIQDHIEMGFSGSNGQPGIDSLITKLSGLTYYQTLFDFAFGSTEITENKIQLALAQFVRSIQSFDSKFDIGRAQVANDAANFPNYTAEENLGKQLFLAPPPAGGAGCQGCHRAPEFDIDPNSLNNGIIGVAGSTDIDLFNTRAPSLRNLFNPQGELNGPLMHNAIFTTIDQVMNHYNLVPVSPQNTNLDPRLQGPGGALQLTQAERDAVVAFLKTLSGNDVYTNEKWSNPFDENGEIEITPLTSGIYDYGQDIALKIYPNPSQHFISLDLPAGRYSLRIIGLNGNQVKQLELDLVRKVNISDLQPGVYMVVVADLKSAKIHKTRFVKN